MSISSSEPGFNYVQRFNDTGPDYEKAFIDFWCGRFGSVPEKETVAFQACRLAFYAGAEFTLSVWKESNRAS